MKGKLFMQACNRNGKTMIRESYFSSPFKLANITDRNAGKMLRLMIMSSSPGVLDDDELALHIQLQDAAEVSLSTQSFQRIFKMNRGAKQKTEITLGRDSFLRYLPLPCVPHEHAIFTAENVIELQPGARLVYGEVITCGRTLNGEKFKFTHLENRTSIVYDGKPLIREVVRMTPGVSDHMSMGLLEGYTHQASFVCIGQGNLQDVALELFSDQKGIDWGISALPANGIIVKLLGTSAYQLHGLLESLANAAERELSCF